MTPFELAVELIEDARRATSYTERSKVAKRIADAIRIVVEEEREACAKLVEDKSELHPFDIAEAIRKRGETP